MNKKWECYPKNKDKIIKIKKQYPIGNLLATILANKDITQAEQIEKFLSPTRNDFYDPYLMPDMDKAINRIVRAIDEKEKIVIYGDYDVDGITSITVLKKFFQERGIDIKTYIPNRLEEGYGLNKQAIEELVKKGYNLMITVDCGITAIEEVELANSLGIETIITDHHEPLQQLPDAIAIVNPKRKDSKYPFNQLAGVGVVFKLIQALSKKLQLEEKEYLKYLDIVCIGTISDIVPLIDENRVITKLGLKLIQVTKNKGLKALLECSGYKKIDSTTISFGIAPRINACGRMGNQQEALRLFLTEDKQEAIQIAKLLNEYNLERQEKEREIFEDAIEEIETHEQKSCIVLGKNGWHHGIIGIVASKVTELYFKPSILICFDGEKGKGSGRSIPGFDLHEALTKTSEHIEKFGGHAMAIGISIKKEEFENFKRDFEQYVDNCNIQNIVPILLIDDEVQIKDITIEAIKELNLLEPFGESNKMPLFLCKNLKIDSIRALSEGKHLKLTLKEDSFYLNAIGFNMGALAEEYKIGDKIDVVGALEINQYNGNETIQMNLKDIRSSY